MFVKKKLFLTYTVTLASFEVKLFSYVMSFIYKIFITYVNILMTWLVRQV